MVGSPAARGGQLIITEGPDSPLVPPPWQSPANQSHWNRIRVRGVAGWAGPSLIAWRQRGFIYSVSAWQPPLTTAQLIAIADSSPD